MSCFVTAEDQLLASRMYVCARWRSHTTLHTSPTRMCHPKWSENNRTHPSFSDSLLHTPSKYLRKGQLNRHTRFRPATTARNTATQRSRMFASLCVAHFSFLGLFGARRPSCPCLFAGCTCFPGGSSCVSYTHQRVLRCPSSEGKSPRAPARIQRRPRRPAIRPRTRRRLGRS